MEVLYKLVEPAEVDHWTVSSLPFGARTVCCRNFLLKRVLPLLPLLTGVCSLLHLQGELLNLNILQLEHLTEQEQSGKGFDISTQHVRFWGLKLFPSTSLSSWWVLVWGALVGAKGPIVFWSVSLVLREVTWGLRSLPVLGDPRFLKTLFGLLCIWQVLS